MDAQKTIVILGASDVPERFSNRAQKLLMEQGYGVIPVHPTLKEVEGVAVIPVLAEVPRHPDVLTVYVSPETGSRLVEDIISLAPSLVIFNPGSENPETERKLGEAGIRFIRACTVMLLTAHRFESVISV